MPGMHVRVAVRVRPLLEHERSSHTSTLLSVEGTRIGVVSRKGGVVSFGVDCVSAEAMAQEAFFAAAGVEQLITASVDGYHSTVFAYGQTGSGKT